MYIKSQHSPTVLTAYSVISMLYVSTQINFFFMVHVLQESQTTVTKEETNTGRATTTTTTEEESMAFLSRLNPK